MKRTLLVIAMSAGAAACATVPPPPPPLVAREPVFAAEEFAWSTRSGAAALTGQVGYRGSAGAYRCTGTAALTPDTPYSRSRIARLYGVTDRAALPAGVVRSRQAGRAGEEYATFVRRSSCDAQGRFAFRNLPAGSWFLIVAARPVSGQGEAMALLRRVDTRRGSLDVVLQ